MPQDVELSGHAVSQEEEVVELNGKLTEDFLKRLELETCAKHIHHAEAALHRWGRATSSRASAIGSWPPRESPGPCSPPLTPKEELPEMPTPGDRSQRQLLEEIWLVDLPRAALAGIFSEGQVQSERGVSDTWHLGAVCIY